MMHQTKKTLCFIAFGVLLYAAAMNLQAVGSFLLKIVSLVFPILLGMVLAFVLNVPMKGFENLFIRVFSKAKKKPNGNLLSVFSLILTLVCIILVISLAATMVIPELVKSVQSIWPLIQERLPEWISYFKEHSVDLTELSEWIAGFDWDQLSNSAGALFGSAVNLVSATASGIANTVFAIIISVYILLSKQVLARQTKRLMTANLPNQIADKFFHIAALVQNTFTKFLSGQCVEAILLGCLILMAYSVLRLPYAGLIAFLTGLSAFVPIVGAFSAGFIGAFLTLLVAPNKVLLGILTHFVVQFIENQFIYPHVVGTSVGLSPLWTLIGALIGGKLFGLPGIIFFIPLVAVLCQLIRDNTNKKLMNRAPLQKEM
ncbi:AI-2E family transporter [Faecalicatena orotica]|uniref:Putative PurR-regulated permease PerM n=1 Tax=Faecalicatena orotica TaxID=1544 RepID=A0A2Y9BKJ7_9FIRM|nr:AI-2E family transporter [Faecalicatena orotica]PWJ22682.1 putative PurR-regulated permease PerM [Faecalicatena orotica]SSA58125.1 Predicted PurR-regulated permease PerM [Faecalicatena orotica]